ncbi:transposase [Adhaeretor mobilis]|nr:transposase [Adhaeretor mobilis]
MLAFHGIFTTYGFWLPNDPRGSWSSWVAKWELYERAGTGTKIRETHSVASRPHRRGERVAAKRVLRYPQVQFDGRQARAVGRGFSEAVKKSGYQILACSIMPDHVHVAVAAQERRPSLILGHLKREATVQLVEEWAHPFKRFQKPGGPLPSCWARQSWQVFLDREVDVHRAIQYVRENPIKAGFNPQRWSCVTENF